MIDLVSKLKKLERGGASPPNAFETREGKRGGWKTKSEKERKKEEKSYI